MVQSEDGPDSKIGPNYPFLDTLESMRRAFYSGYLSGCA